MTGASPQIRLHIERLVVDAELLQPSQRGQLERVVVAGLTSALERNGVASLDTRNHASLVAPDLQAPRAPSAGDLGSGIAASVASCLDRPAPPHSKGFSR